MLKGLNTCRDIFLVYPQGIKGVQGSIFPKLTGFQGLNASRIPKIQGFWVSRDRGFPLLTGAFNELAFPNSKGFRENI